MDVLAQVQGIVMEHAFTIGIALLITLVIAGIVWFYMSSSSPKEALVNQARVNGATTDSPNPNQESQEESPPSVPYGVPEEGSENE